MNGLSRIDAVFFTEGTSRACHCLTDFYREECRVSQQQTEPLGLSFSGRCVKYLSNEMIDEDLAQLYQVPTHRLNEQVKRNRKRFPQDFMFQLTKVEAEGLRSQIAISKSGRGGRRSLPYVFTEQGVAMLSTVLNSERAIEVNITIMRAFVKLRRWRQTKS